MKLQNRTFILLLFVWILIFFYLDINRIFEKAKYNFEIVRKPENNSLSLKKYLKFHPIRFPGTIKYYLFLTKHFHI